MTDDFAAVDGGDTARLVAMMHATDAWPAVRDARDWVLTHLAARRGPVIDLGSGPGTFGALAAARGAATVDLDTSVAMLRAGRRAGGGGGAVCGDVTRLPVRDAVAALTRAERVLQWTADPAAPLAEAWRVTAPGGVVAVTDTDWSTFRIDHDDPGTAAAWSAAALGWVPHPRLAAELPDRLGAMGLEAVATRHDVVVLDAWDPDDGSHADGPPGLPLHSIADGAGPAGRDALHRDVPVLAERARHGRFRAALTLVTALGTRP